MKHFFFSGYRVSVKFISLGDFFACLPQNIVDLYLLRLFLNMNTSCTHFALLKSISIFTCLRERKRALRHTESHPNVHNIQGLGEDKARSSELHLILLIRKAENQELDHCPCSQSAYLFAGL